jgi:Short C-terminal domain
MGLLFRPRRPLMRLVAGATTVTVVEAADCSTEIERLAKLHRQGALSKQEFATAKAKVIGR